MIPDDYFMYRVTPVFEEEDFEVPGPAPLRQTASVASGISDAKSTKSVFSDAGEIKLDGIGNIAELEGPQ